MDHEHHTQDAVDGPWAGGWLVAACAAVFAAVLARVIGDVSITPAVALGAFVFTVFGVLLGAGGVELRPLGTGETDDHGHGHH
jgi:hypothetical protein